MDYEWPAKWIARIERRFLWNVGYGVERISTTTYNQLISSLETDNSGLWFVHKVNQPVIHCLHFLSPHFHYTGFSRHTLEILWKNCHTFRVALRSPVPRVNMLIKKDLLHPINVSVFGKPFVFRKSSALDFSGNVFLFVFFPIFYVFFLFLFVSICLNIHSDGLPICQTHLDEQIRWSYRLIDKLK